MQSLQIRRSVHFIWKRPETARFGYQIDLAAPSKTLQVAPELNESQRPTQM